MLAVGDFRFRLKCLNRIKQLKETGVCIVLVSHTAGHLMRTCTRGVVVDRGKNVFDGPIMPAVLRYEGARVHDEIGTSGGLRPGQAENVRFEQISLRVAGKNTAEIKSGAAVDIEMRINASVPVDLARVVVSLFHSEFGVLFNISSYLDNDWIKLKRGENVITLCLGELPLQFGSYYVEASVRGEELGDVYDVARSSNALLVTDPVPNYEGFGINGVLMPARKWLVA